MTTIRALLKTNAGFPEHNSREVGLFLLHSSPKRIKKFLSDPSHWAGARYWYYDSYDRYAIATSLADYIDASPAVQKHLKQLGINYRGLLEPARTRQSQQSQQSKDASPTASASGTLPRNQRLPKKENEKKAEAKGKSSAQKTGKERVKIKDASREVIAATKFIEQKTGEGKEQTGGVSRKESAEAESTTQDTGGVSRSQQQSPRSVEGTEKKQVILPPLVEKAPSLNAPPSVEQMVITLPAHHQGRHLQKPLRLLNKDGGIAVLNMSGWSEQDINQLTGASRDAPQTFFLQRTNDDQSYIGALRPAEDDTTAVPRWLRRVLGGIGIQRPRSGPAPKRYELCILGSTGMQASQSRTLQNDLKIAFAAALKLSSVSITVKVITEPMQAPPADAPTAPSKRADSHASGLIAMRMVKYFHERWDAQLDKGSHPSLKEVFREISTVRQERDFAEHSKDLTTLPQAAHGAPSPVQPVSQQNTTESTGLPENQTSEPSTSQATTDSNNQLVPEINRMKTDGAMTHWDDEWGSHIREPLCYISPGKDRKHLPHLDRLNSSDKSPWRNASDKPCTFFVNAAKERHWLAGAIRQPEPGQYEIGLFSSIKPEDGQLVEQTLEGDMRTAFADFLQVDPKLVTVHVVARNLQEPAAMTNTCGPLAMRMAQGFHIQNSNKISFAKCFYRACTDWIETFSDTPSQVKNLKKLLAPMDAANKTYQDSLKQIVQNVSEQNQNMVEGFAQDNLIEEMIMD